MSESDAVAALNELGLTAYEAKVFIALLKLGTGTASEVSHVADVPRSQVYGAAEQLEAQGLLEVQQASPMRYRPVSLDTAREHLRSRFEAHEADAFEYLERADAEGADLREHQEDIWTVQETEAIETRVRDLVTDATDTVVYACSDEQLTPAIADALSGRAAAGADVTVVSTDADFATLDEGVATVRFVPEGGQSRERSGRALTVDRRSILLSVHGDETLPGESRETAIWSSDTAFAGVLSQLLRNWFETHMDGL